MSSKKIYNIGILAIQGDYAAHKEALIKSSLGEISKIVFVKKAEQLVNLDALILPGGESTSMLKLLNKDFIEGIIELNKLGKVIFGTCAGAILLAKSVSNPNQTSLGLIDVDIIRNAYGRQINSFITTDLEVNPNSSFHNILNTKTEAVFIRAPIISRIGLDVEALLNKDGNPILVRQNKILLATFHPELSKEVHPIYQILLELLSQ